MRPIFLFLLIIFPFLNSAQHQDKVDFISANARIRVFHEINSLRGEVVYKFNVLEIVDSIFLDAKNIEFQRVSLDGKEVDFLYDGKRISISKRFKAGNSYKIHLRYFCTPKQTVYFTGFEDENLENDQVWTQGQGKYTSHWLPSFDDMEEKVKFTFDVIADKRLEVIVNGAQSGSAKDYNESIGFVSAESKYEYYPTRSWHYYMQKPMSSYLLAFAVGNYEKEELKSKSGIPIENYYYPKDSLRVEPTYRYTKEIFDFIEKEIGFPYPWQNYKQIPVRDFLYAGMENTTATIFSDGYVIDSTAFIDKNYVNVNAHELAHQWFGNLVTEKDGNHHWLHEGFATYYAQLAEKEIFGDDHYYWKLYASLIQLQNGVDRGEGQSLTDPKASSLIFYEKGAWALYMLRNRIGDKAFKKGIQAYLEKYQFKNATIADFLKEMEIVSKEDLSDFRKVWLENIDLPFEVAKKQLREDSESLDVLFSLEEELQKAQGDAIDYDGYWEKTNSVHLKQHILGKYTRVADEDLWNKAFESDTLPVRQMIALKMDSISPSFKSKFESLLEDESYLSIENALFKLWVSFPEEKAKYLEQTKDIVGLPNKNVRLLWLTLAILTNDYNGRNTQVHFKELNSYTAKEYGWEVRMGAFQYLNQALGLNEDSLRSLVDATSHHSWQFKKFARNLVDELIKDEDYRSRFETLISELNEEETRYLKTKFK